MNIYDLPIPNFGELSNEQALELILEVRSRRRFTVVKRGGASERRPQDAQANERRNSKTKLDPAPRAKRFNTPFGKFTKEEMQALLANLK